MESKVFYLLLTTFAISILKSHSQTNYCFIKSCPTPSNHLACHNDQIYEYNCPDLVESVNISDTLKWQIVDYHNELRSSVAGGNVKPFPTAIHMGAIHWDDNLAYVAKLLSLHCGEIPQKCLATNKYPNVAVVIVSSSVDSKKDAENTENWMNSQLREAFNTHSACKADIIDHYKKPNNCDQFLTLVREGNNHVGCAINRWTEGSKFNQMLVCLYPSINQVDSRVYAKGKTATKCKKRDMDYRKLCRTEKSLML